MNFSISLFLMIFLPIILGYGFGSIMFSIIIAKCCYKVDITKCSSKNPGTTNTLRVLGKKAGLSVLFLDVFKIIIPTLIIWAIYTFALEKYFINVNPKFEFANLIYLTCLFGIIGHIFPIWFKFRGGKGVASSLGFYICLSPFIGILFILMMLLIVLITKYVSLSSIITTWICAILTLIPFVNYFYLSNPDLLSINENLANYTLNACFIFGISIIISILVTIKHKSNIIKIKNKEENKLYLIKKFKKEQIKNSDE